MDFFFNEFFKALIPIGICVVLPVWIVTIIFKNAKNKDDKKAEIILKAIESNPNINANDFVGILGKQQKPQPLLQSRLLRGCIFAFLGIAAAVVAVVLRFSSIAQTMDPDDVAGLFITLLIFGCGFLAIGLAYLVVYYVCRKSANDND